MEFVTILKTGELFRLALGLVPNIPDKKSEASAEPADIILRWALRKSMKMLNLLPMFDNWAEQKS